MRDQPVIVTIKVSSPNGDITIQHTQRVDSVGRFLEMADAPMKRATADAASWLRRHGKEPRR